jgi:hypothetical protein
MTPISHFSPNMLWRDTKSKLKPKVLIFTSGPRSRKINKRLPSLVPASPEKPRLLADQAFEFESSADLSMLWTTPDNLALEGNLNKRTSVKPKSASQASQSPDLQDSMDISRTKIRKRLSDPASSLDLGNVPCQSRPNSVDISISLKL